MKAIIFFSFLLAVFCVVFGAPQPDADSEERVIDTQDFVDCEGRTACTDGEDVWWCDKKGVKPEKAEELICVPYYRWFETAICTDCNEIYFYKDE